MNYHKYYSVDVVNGPGTRCTLFVSGCIHQCKGCYNKRTWKVNSGKPYDKALEDKIIQDLQDTKIKRQGLSLSGGDPLLPDNLSVILRLLQRVKNECPNKNVWVWTGYRLQDLTDEQKMLLSYIDVLIDGQFIESEADKTLVWRGSQNQIIHYLKKLE
ncbi:anaerobic ribonucleoside-triphosphate reductase-activating protein [Wohlfahrtiimonas larvae]|nr:anaerobic ribonucleoside-triphosphate reductase-activating protein [Wohlfahrtiimonas larvae]